MTATKTASHIRYGRGRAGSLTRTLFQLRVDRSGCEQEIGPSSFGLIDRGCLVECVHGILCSGKPRIRLLSGGEFHGGNRHTPRSGRGSSLARVQFPELALHL